MNTNTGGGFSQATKGVALTSSEYIPSDGFCYIYPNEDTIINVDFVGGGTNIAISLIAGVIPPIQFSKIYANANNTKVVAII